MNEMICGRERGEMWEIEARKTASVKLFLSIVIFT